MSPAAIILGNDAILATRPNTTAQLTHACGAAGFDIVVPPSWGDELVARACLDQLSGRSEDAIIACACDRVRTVVMANASVGEPGQPAIVSLASPPVAAARYLRLVHGDALLVTYVGGCPSASDPSIDARFSPAGFLASLHRQGIALDAQPNEVSPAEADRWRRYQSVPGGLPARRYLARPPIGRVVREIEGTGATGTVPTSRAKVVLDLAPAAGCVCAAERARIDEEELERSATPIVTASHGLDLSPAPTAPRARQTLRARPAVEAPTMIAVAAPPAAPMPASAASTALAVATGLGEPALPAAEPNANARPAASAPPRRPAGPSLPADPPRPVTTPSTASLEADRRRTIALVALPAGVLGAVAALGIAVYLGAAQHSPRHEAPGQAAPSGGADSVMPRTTSPGELISGDTARHAARSPTDTGSRVPSQAAAPTAARDTNVSPADTAAPNRAQRARRSRPPEAVPGWLPQGQPTFTPKDSRELRQPDSSARARPDAPLDT